MCTKIENEMFYMIHDTITYGFKNKLFKNGDSCSLPIKISIKIELDNNLTEKQERKIRNLKSSQQYEKEFNENNN
jgi:hypothetical protein